MYHSFIILIFILFVACTSGGKRKLSDKDSVQISGNVHFDTLPNGQRILNNIDSSFFYYYKEVVGPDTLTDGYITCYGIDDSMNYFYLRHGDTLRLLSKAPRSVSAWSMGLFEKEKGGFLLTRIDNGNSFPVSYQVFKKSTGKNIFGEGAVVCDYRELGNDIFFLLHSWDVPTGRDSMSAIVDSISLYSLNSGKTEIFRIVYRKSMETNYYTIGSLTRASLVIECWNGFMSDMEVHRFERRRTR